MSWCCLTHFWNCTQNATCDQANPTHSSTYLVQAVAAEAAFAGTIKEMTGTNPYDIEVLLHWAYPVDLDLRVSDPMKCEVGYNNLLSCSGGMLFEDMVPNCDDRKGKFEEKITWKLGGATPGIYVIRPQVGIFVPCMQCSGSQHVHAAQPGHMRSVQHGVAVM
jgi:hypothetical protein